MMKKAYFLIAGSLITSVIITGSAMCQGFKYESKGKRDPFVPLIGIEKARAGSLEDIISIDDVHLEGIAVGARGRRTVLINGEMLKENDKVGLLVIKKIGEKTVVLLIDGKEYSLNLPEEGGVKGE